MCLFYEVGEEKRIKGNEKENNNKRQRRDMQSKAKLIENINKVVNGQHLAPWLREQREVFPEQRAGWETGA